MDYISKEKLRHAMYHEAFETDTELQKWESGCWIRYRLFNDVLDALPASDVVERKKGKWILVDHDGSWRVSACSVCSKRVHYINYEPNYDFCPNCGADMREESNGES